MSERAFCPVWESLPTERQQGLVRTLGRMAMRQIRNPSTASQTIGETADDDRRDLTPRPPGGLSEKIFRRHRERLAIVYIRQSTVQQVERHQESTRLQYALVDRAFHLGWARETIVVVDDDLGRSGARAC